MDKFRVINQLEDVSVRKRYVKDGGQPATPGMAQDGNEDQDDDNADGEKHEDEDELEDGLTADNGLMKSEKKKPPLQYLTHKIASEIYTNDHVSAFYH